ncbi:MAG: hypothetical protein HOE19_00445 [Candidatus Komeilibacteria bacterium]|jgi:hypothetical protein|nr:hypothetical protein [Candidatus Komeilibacteria bacterium]MBT4447399.1 hypothetical protein [Candidatus Komeilibacteria bacterium]
MSEKNISEQILDKIKDVKPKPRWQFLLKDYIIWLAASLALIISSLAFAVVLYMMIDNDWDIYSNISNSLLEFVFLTLPYFWLLFLGAFILIAYYYFRHTKKGYKFSLSKIFLVSLAINIFIGAFLYNAGVGQAIDGIVAQRVPFYKELINRRQHIWSRVDDGLLGGVVVGIEDEHLSLEDMEGNIWIIQHFNTTTPNFINLQIGDHVRMIGQKIDSQNFKMYRIMPMRGMHWMKEHCPVDKEHCPFMNERKF